MAARVERGQTHDVKKTSAFRSAVFILPPRRGKHAGGASPSPTERRGQGAAPPWLPLTREVAKPQVLTEGEKSDVLQNLRFFSPSVSCADSSLVRGSHGGAAPCPRFPAGEGLAPPARFPHWGKCRAQRGDRGHGPPCAKSSGRAFTLPEPRCGSTFPLRAFRGR